MRRFGNPLVLLIIAMFLASLEGASVWQNSLFPASSVLSGYTVLSVESFVNFVFYVLALVFSFMLLFCYILARLLLKIRQGGPNGPRGGQPLVSTRNQSTVLVGRFRDSSKYEKRQGDIAACVGKREVQKGLHPRFFDVHRTVLFYT